MSKNRAAVRQIMGVRSHRFYAMLVCAAIGTGCSDHTGISNPAGKPDTTTPLPPTPFIASSAIPTSAGAVAGVTGQGLAYISLPQGTIPAGTVARIRNRRTSDTMIVAVIDGGFDPVGMPAQTGDTLSIDVTGPGAGPLHFAVTVMPRRPPVVVRTNPPPKKRDVPWNSIITIVFSEPVNAATIVPATVSLRAGATVIAGQLGFMDSSHTAVTFSPAAVLSPNTDYDVVIGTGIKDLNGDGLDSSLIVGFTTAATSVAPPPPVTGFLLSQPERSQNDTGLFTFVALPRGSFPSAIYVDLRNKRTADYNGAFLDSGGFDPLRVRAAVGDTIEIQLNRAGSSQVYERVVPAASVPRLVRSSPASGQAGVKRGVAITVVFSEPLDFNSISYTALPYGIQVWHGDTAISGNLGFGEGLYYFLADSNFVLGSDYRLTVDGSIRAVSGVGLPSAFTIPFTIENPPAGAPTAKLAGVSASIVEFQYPDLPGHWFYAPQARVQETTGLDSAFIDHLEIIIPGIAGKAPLCMRNSSIGAGQSIDLFVLEYGDFELTFDTPGSRATGTTGSVVVVYRDPAGRTDSLAMTAPIVPSSPNAVYPSGGTTGHGYYWPVGMRSCP